MERLVYQISFETSEYDIIFLRTYINVSKASHRRNSVTTIPSQSSDVGSTDESKGKKKLNVQEFGLGKINGM